MTNPEFERVSRENNGARTSKGFEFHRRRDAAAVCAHYGHEVTFPFPGRAITIVHDRDKLFVQTVALADDVCSWSSTEKKKHWSLVLEIEPEAVEMKRIRIAEYKNENGTGAPAGFFLETKRGWRARNANSMKNFVMFLYGVNKGEAEIMMGAQEEDPWLLQSIPFVEEEPGGKIWNRDAPQLAYKPVPGPHPNWDMIFRHAGRGLDKYIPPDLKAIGIDSGGKYLLAWFASILRDPALRLPYLFFFGSENCGKSILWEAFSLLVTHGVVKADRALTSDFNGEIDGAILCVIEEKDISRAAGVLERVKDAVTGLTLSIRRMRTDQYTAVNYTHWLQTSNNRNACLIAPGDTRMMAIAVHDITGEVPKAELLELLKAEAPAVVATMLSMKLPTPEGRLAMPVISTPDKLLVQSEHLDPLADMIIQFMSDKDKWRGTAADLREAVGSGPGDMRKLNSAVNKFAPYLATHGVTAKFPHGRTKSGKIIILTREKQA